MGGGGGGAQKTTSSMQYLQFRYILQFISCAGIPLTFSLLEGSMTLKMIMNVLL